jgi:hypothetical protein
VEVNFGSSPEFSVGIEEEFQPVGDERYELVSRGRRGRRSPRSSTTSSRPPGASAVRGSWRTWRRSSSAEPEPTSQRRVHAETDSLLAVARWLVEHTRRD